LHAAHELRAKHLGPDHPLTADSIHTLGRLAHVEGDYFAAEEFYRRALALRQSLSPPPEKAIADTEFNLAWLLAELDEFDESAELYRRTIRRRERAFGPEHREVGIGRAGLAGVYLAQGNLLAAFTEAKPAHRILLAREGTGKIAEAVAHFQEGVFLSWSKKHPEAEQKLAASLELARDSLPRQHMYLGFPLFQLGREQALLKKDAEAEKHLRECLDVGRANELMTHPRVAYPVRALADVLRRNRRPDEARRLFDEWLAAHRARPSPFLADALTDWADFLFDLRDETQERAVLEEALMLYRREPRPPRRLTYLQCLRDLAWNYGRGGRYAEMEPLAVEHVAARRRRGDNATALALALNQLAFARLRQRKTGPEVEADLKEARTLLTPALAFLKPPSDLVSINLNLSFLYRLRNHPDQAVPFAMAARDQATRVPDLLTAARELAWCASDVRRLNPKPTPSQIAASRRYAEEAVRTLTQARQRGLSSVAALGKEKAFAVLGERPDFQKLLRELGAKKP
jgi:tetratricopeptide (TPR) repeat protein